MLCKDTRQEESDALLLLSSSIPFHAVQYSCSYLRMVHTVFDFLVRSCHLNLNWKRTVSFNRNMTPRQTQTACIFILISLQHFYSKIWFYAFSHEPSPQFFFFWK
jgi:hypothetical protein